MRTYLVCTGTTRHDRNPSQRRNAYFKSLLAALALSLAAANAFAGAVNINTADAASLAAALKGVGQKQGRSHRRLSQGTRRVQERRPSLAQVKGIGQKLVDKNRDPDPGGRRRPKAKAESKPAAKAEAQPAS